MDAQDIRAVRGVAGTAARSVAGWMSGAALVLFGVLLCGWMSGDIHGELAPSPEQGTFTVQSCRGAAGGGFTCAGSFTPETGGGEKHGTLHTDGRRAGGEDVHAEDTFVSFTENTYEPVPPHRLRGQVVVLGLAFVSVAAGVFALLSGYSPRPLYAGSGAG
jgi:hypothetical protein